MSLVESYILKDTTWREDLSISLILIFKNSVLVQHQWFIPVMLAIWETEFRMTDI
jgi:hypothetical protein